MTRRLSRLALARFGTMHQRVSTPSLSTPVFLMSTITDRSTVNFTAIFEAASNKYMTLAKQYRESHPLAAALENYTVALLIPS